MKALQTSKENITSLRAYAPLAQWRGNVRSVRSGKLNLRLVSVWTFDRANDLTVFSARFSGRSRKV